MYLLVIFAHGYQPLGLNDAQEAWLNYFTLGTKGNYNPYAPVINDLEVLTMKLTIEFLMGCY